MQALRQRAACVSRYPRLNSLRSSRSYASDSHSHHHSAPPVEESLGACFYLGLAVIPATILVYSISRPGKDGEPSSLTKFIEKYSDLNKKWEERNTLHTAVIEQAAHDRHLLYNAGKNVHIELNYPEVFQTGSPYNVPAGHYPKLDHVIAHYQEKHLKEEEQKAKKLAAKDRD